MAVEFDPWVTLATQKLREPIIRMLAEMGASDIDQISFLLGEDRGVVAGALKRMADEGEVELNTTERRVQLPEE